MHTIMQLISNFFYKKKHISFYLNTCSLDELDKKKLYQNFKGFKFWTKKLQGKRHFFKAFGDLFIFISFIIFNSKCKSHVQQIAIHKKTCLVVIRNSFLHFFLFALVNLILMHNYVNMWKITWIILLLIIQFFSLKFVSCKCNL
jgi:hypothetical protein